MPPSRALPSGPITAGLQGTMVRIAERRVRAGHGTREYLGHIFAFGTVTHPVGAAELADGTLARARRPGACGGALRRRGRRRGGAGIAAGLGQTARRVAEHGCRAGRRCGHDLRRVQSLAAEAHFARAAEPAVLALDGAFGPGHRFRTGPGIRQRESAEIQRAGHGALLARRDILVLPGRRQRDAGGRLARIGARADHERAGEASQAGGRAVGAVRRECAVVVLQYCGRLRAECAVADENIVLDERGRRHLAADEQERSAGEVIHDRVVDEVEILARIGRTFFAVRHDGRILIGGRLLDD
ncbi:conserved hypothetical protein, partial [Ricinus communis]